RFDQAVKLWFLYFLCFLGVFILTGAGFALGIVQESTPLEIGSLIAGAVLVLIVLFNLPMKLYNLSFPAAFAFVVISLVLNAAAQVAAARWLPLARQFQEQRRITTQIGRL